MYEPQVSRKHALVLRCKRIRISTFQIKYANQPIAQQQRNHKFRAHNNVFFHLHEARIIQRVRDANRAALARRSSRDPVMQRKAKPIGIASHSANQKCSREAAHTRSTSAEKVIINDFLDALRHAA